MSSICAPAKYPERKRFSSYQSARGYYDRYIPPQRHELWLPDTDASPNPKGQLLFRATLNSDGQMGYGGDIGMDFFYGRVASSLAYMHDEGFAPILNAIDLSVVSGIEVNDGYNEAYAKVEFPPTETFVTLGNSVLEKCDADLRFAVMPAGQYSAEAFTEMLSNDIYPLSACASTPDTEQNGDEYGTHDMLLHAAAVLAIATTDAYPHLRQRARDTQQNIGDYDIPYRDAVEGRDTLMYHMDGGLHVMVCSDILADYGERDVYFHRALGRHVTEAQRDIYQQQLIDNLRDPLAHGFRALAGDGQ